MFKKIRTLLAASLALASLVAVPIGTSAVAAGAADITNCLSQGSNLDASKIGGTCSGTTKTSGSVDRVNSIITTVVNVFSLIVGIAAVIMIIYGGFRYVTSGGDSNATGSAKSTILYAIIGLVIVAFAQAIVQFVINKSTT